MKQLDHCQAWVIQSENTIFLQSYATIVISVNDNELRCTGLYSMTTRRHIGRFLKQYGFKYLSYYSIKFLTELNAKLDEWVIKDPYTPNWYYYNTETGEILEPAR